MRNQLKDHIKAVLDGIRHLSVDDAADMIAEISDEIAMIISEVVMRFCDSPLEAVAILGQAVTFTAAEGADQDGRVIQ